MGPATVPYKFPRWFGSPLKFENHCPGQRESSWGANLVVPLHFTEGNMKHFTKRTRTWLKRPRS